MPFQSSLLCFKEKEEVEEVVESIISSFKELFKHKWPSEDNIQDYPSPHIHWENILVNKCGIPDKILNHALGCIITGSQFARMANLGLEFSMSGYKRKIYMNSKFKTVYYDAEVEKSLTLQWCRLVSVAAGLEPAHNHTNQTSNNDIAVNNNNEHSITEINCTSYTGKRRMDNVFSPTSVKKPVEEELKKSRKNEISHVLKQFCFQLKNNSKKQDNKKQIDILLNVHNSEKQTNNAIKEIYSTAKIEKNKELQHIIGSNLRNQHMQKSDMEKLLCTNISAREFNWFGTSDWKCIKVSKGINHNKDVVDRFTQYLINHGVMTANGRTIRDKNNKRIAVS